MSLMMPKFLKAYEKKNLVPPGNSVLVVLQLSGGNDGLNTVVPFRNDIYHQLRPTLSLNQSSILPLTDEVGLPTALSAFKSLYDEGSLAIMNNVGYPNPDRSHFRSMDIWHTASQSNEYLNSGWLGRYLDTQCKNCKYPTYALEIDDMLSLALKGEHNNGLAFKEVNRLFGTTNAKMFKALASKYHEIEHEKPVDYLYKTLAETVSSAGYIFEQGKHSYSKATYPNTDLGKGFRTIASLIFSEINTKVYYISLGSFDTHVGQQNQQKRLFEEMNVAINAFTNDLKGNHRFNDVLLITFSEFGRRVAQNASNGTDHGTANNMFFIGGALKQKGILNAMPDLQNLSEGDLKFTVDFKSVYATILERWLKIDAVTVLQKKYPVLDFI